MNEEFMGWDHDLDLSGGRGLLPGEAKAIQKQVAKRVRELGLSRCFKQRPRHRVQNGVPVPGPEEATTD